jgi:hypothetical protein
MSKQQQFFNMQNLESADAGKTNAKSTPRSSTWQDVVPKVKCKLPQKYQ